MGFGLLDWIILAGSLLLVFYFGLLGRRYVRDTADFLLAGRRMGLYVGTISLVSTEIGIITYMYYAEMGVLFGFTAFISGLITAGIYYLLGTSGFVIRRFRELQLMTISEYFEQKYSRRLRILAGTLMAVGGALNFGVFPIIEATFLNIVTGIPQDYIIWTMVVLIGMVLVYTSAGGMVSVLVTNYIQYVVLALGMIIVTLYCFAEVGWGPMVSTVRSRIGDSGFNPLIHPSFGWQFVVWQILFWLAALTAWAPVAARAFSSENSQVGMRIFRWTGLIFLGRAILPMLWGIAALTYFEGRQFTPIEGAPLFMREVLPAGIKGVIVAGMLAASMSTYSGYLLAWSSVISEDIIRPLRRRPFTGRAELWINKITVFGLAVFIVIWGLFYVVPSATFFYLQMTANLFLAGTFWSLVGGLYWPRAHKLGAYCAFLFGGAATLAYFVIPEPESWTGAIGVASYVLAFIGMVFGSLAGRAALSPLLRAMIVAAPALLAGAATLIYWRLAPAQGWLAFWTAAMAVSFVLFALLSTVAVVKGFGELRRMLRLMLEREPPGPAPLPDRSQETAGNGGSDPSA